VHSEQLIKIRCGVGLTVKWLSAPGRRGDGTKRGIGRSSPFRVRVVQAIDRIQRLIGTATGENERRFTQRFLIRTGLSGGDDESDIRSGLFERKGWWSARSTDGTLTMAAKFLEAEAGCDLRGGQVGKREHNKWGAHTTVPQCSGSAKAAGDEACGGTWFHAGGTLITTHSSPTRLLIQERGVCVCASAVNAITCLSACRFEHGERDEKDGKTP
jgi:hypothetical protein